MLKKICNIILTVIISIVFILVILLAGVRLVGLNPYTVLSGSMEPTYHVGSLIYVTDVNPSKMKMNEPVTYRIDGGTVVTHRIVEVVYDETNSRVIGYHTKGDANKDMDGGLLPINNIIGKPVFSIPYMGYVADVVQKPQTIVIIAGACIILYLITYIADLISSLKNKENEER